MLMNEKEVEVMWCPMSRPKRDDGSSGYNRLPDEIDDFSGAYCQGSSCMMFRWQDADPENHNGYCGLAGPINYGGMK
jgi:hypothetical protein